MYATLGIVFIVFLLAVLASCVKIVQQAQVLVIERLGAYQDSWGTGLHFKIPFIDRVAKRIDLKEQVVDFVPQAVITKDNVTMQIDTVVFYQVTDPKLFCYGVANPIMAIENLTATTLRNIIGELELDQTLTSRETINTKMRSELDLATDPWGIKVNRVELKNIIPPAEIRDAMEKQMKAERERRESILQAEGEKKSTILVAEGEAEAILKVQKANAQGLQFLKEAGADQAVLTLKSLEAFGKTASGSVFAILHTIQTIRAHKDLKAVWHYETDTAMHRFFSCPHRNVCKSRRRATFCYHNGKKKGSGRIELRTEARRYFLCLQRTYSRVRTGSRKARRHCL